MTTKAPTFIELFAGIGGFRLGLEKAGFQCIFSSEINQYCRETYKNNFSEVPDGDITKIPVKKIPEHDILTAGFPCQSFSICGKRKGFKDTRGTLFFYLCEIIKYHRPKVIFLENVKFLIHHNGGETLATMIETLHEFGYFVHYRVFNALHFGLPQNRERIIIMASRITPFNFSRVKCKTTEDISLLNFLDQKGSFEYLNKKDYTMIKTPIQKVDSGLFFVGYRNKGIWKRGIRPNTKHLSRVHRQPNRIYSALGTHPTIPSQEPSGRFFIHIPQEDRVRKLTIRECYRIMGFPEKYKISTKKSEAYKQIGNSICVPMVYHLSRQIKKQGLLDDANFIKPPKSFKKSVQLSLGL